MFEAIQNFNIVTKTGYINFLVGGIITTTLSFDEATKKFTLSERLTPLIIPPNDLQSWLYIINNWLSNAGRYIDMSNGSIGEFKIEFKQERSPDKIEMSGEINETEIAAEWTDSDIEIAPRAELIMNRSELVLFLKSYHGLIEYINAF